jgi:hypothetical protein
MSVNATDHGRVNSAGRGDRAKEYFGDLRKGQRGIGDDDVRIGDLSKTSVGEECAGDGGSAHLEHPIPRDKGQIVRACHV